MDQSIWLILAVLAVLALLVIRKGFFWTFIGPRNLRYDQLDELLQRGDGIELVAQEERGGAKQWQFRTREGSVMYFHSAEKESLDVNVPGTAGLLIFFNRGQIVATQRAGTHYRNEQPKLSSVAQSQIAALLFRVRELAQEHPFTQ
tara:strand:- start:1386 stop:1823 length:438 start_codon:yes stop_codon:yes gene_type:complete